MSNRISSVNGATSAPDIGRIGGTLGSNLPPITNGIQIQENLHFPKLELEERESGGVAIEDRPNREALVDLFFDIVQTGIDIVPTLPRDHGGYVVEASFRPAKNGNVNPAILVPVRGVTESLKSLRNLSSSKTLRFIVTKYADAIIEHSNDADILRLIIVISHEFGHYISFARGFHDQPLQFGLSLMHSKQVSKEVAQYTWLVFREECIAWRNATHVLKRSEFAYWKDFEKVKNHSLSTYYVTLKLRDAPLQVYYKLSLLGEDFRKNSITEEQLKRQALSF